MVLIMSIWNLELRKVKKSNLKLRQSVLIYGPKSHLPSQLFLEDFLLKCSTVVVCLVLHKGTYLAVFLCMHGYWFAKVNACWNSRWASCLICSPWLTERPIEVNAPYALCSLIHWFHPGTIKHYHVVWKYLLKRVYCFCFGHRVHNAA